MSYSVTFSRLTVVIVLILKLNLGSLNVFVRHGILRCLIVGQSAPNKRIRSIDQPFELSIIQVGLSSQFICNFVNETVNETVKQFHLCGITTLLF